MNHGRQLLLLVLVLLSFVFFANVQSGVISNTSQQGWMVENCPQGHNDTGVAPTRALGAGFSLNAESTEIKRFPIETEEPKFFDAPRPGIIAPFRVTEDRADQLPIKASTIPLQKSFDGLKFGGLYPADNTVAVGPTAIVIAVNSSYAIYTKTGGKRAQRTFDSWFSGLTETKNAFFFDPKLAYDQYTGHFVMVVDAIRESDKRAWYILAVSETSNPEGFWTFWALDQNLNNKTRTKFWADYPAIGIDAGAIYMTGNVFDFVPGNFKYAKLRIVKKSEVYQFGSITFHDFWNLKDAAGGLAFTVQPARSTGSTPSESMVSTKNGSATSLTLWAVKNATTNPVVTKKKVPITQFHFAPNAKQKGGGSFISTNDARLSDAVWINGAIYVAHSVEHNWGSGNVSSVRFYSVRTSDGAILQDGLFGADKLNYFFPSIATDSRGNTAIVFIRSGDTEFVSVRFTGRKSTDSPSIVQQSTQIKAGLHNYFLDPDSFGAERWGDYCGIGVDSDDSFFMYGMYAGSPSTRWQTRVAKTRVP